MNKTPQLEIALKLIQTLNTKELGYLSSVIDNIELVKEFQIPTEKEK